MANEKSEDKKEGALKADSETLHTTDPQEHMEDPISSLMKKAEKGFEKEGNESAAEKDGEK